ncbi:uncharacterized protein N7503_008411 [Penicillium pulvis]|uniref:uncharacterized protein n=1 Tax=Penicillium pulvis TaxID=1562058 RepID=UPI0025491BE2|nr:uncharacterized protein N7503_008411 [Penicillium pulvis]KAJ5792433.1 hypothetical protein N7503_008411 [Penicillium pulvis]
MATAHATHLTAGPMASSASITADEVREYERILKISDEIFSGSHPRLKVPQKFVRKPKGQPGQNGQLAQQTLKSKPMVPEPVPQIDNSRHPQNIQAKTPGNASFPATASATPARVAAKPSSEIDPIFLTKSDDLVRAELQLQRQRVERTLRDQLEQKKQDLKQKPSVQDTKPNFDVSDVLNRALEIVKPVSLSDPSENSFDENSYYSSKAPDSPPAVGEHQDPSPVVPARALGASAGASVEQFADELQRLETLNRTGSDQEMQDAYSVADHRIPHPQKQLHPNQTEASRLHKAHHIDPLEEPEYSPPAPVAPPIDHRDYQREAANSQGRARYAEQPRDVQALPNGHNVTVVRNHITSPAAPRPSRVSPLATQKLPAVQQIRDERFEHVLERVYSDPESGRASPNGPVSQPISRKRRRQEKGQDVRVSYKRQNADSSDAYIKEEPVSPPPFTDDHAISRSRQPQEQPVYIDISSPGYNPVIERRELSGRGPVYEVDQYREVPVEQGPPRTMSRVSTRRPVLDDPNLRRVASMQYARQPEYSQGYIEHDPRDIRSASYAVVERRLPEQSRYYEEVPSYGPRYIEVDDQPPPTYRPQYYEEPQPPRAMPPPPRRYFVDEHGNEYEMVPSRRTQTMAPPPRPASRAPPPQAEIYDDRAPIRTASVRAPSIVQEPYMDNRYIQEMPPPQPIYRRVPSDYARPIAGERQTYVAPLEGHEPYSRAGSVQVAEYMPRRQNYVEEHSIPQERVIRTASVRPQPHQHRYEEQPHEIIQRVGNSRPAGASREVYMDERPMGDYVERPYYVRERRYYEGDDGNRMALDGNTESVHRAPQHY